jgi:Ni/Fe-hydrogenase subunit HybB-like protein
MAVLRAMVSGVYATPFWIMLVLIYVIPLSTLTFPAFRQWPLGMMLVGIGINLGMYIERMLILLPPLARPRLTYNWSSYFPSWGELTIVLGSFALAILLYLLAVKFVPIISIWEEKEGRLRTRE